MLQTFRFRYGIRQFEEKLLARVMFNGHYGFLIGGSQGLSSVWDTLTNHGGPGYFQCLSVLPPWQKDG